MLQASIVHRQIRKSAILRLAGEHVEHNAALRRSGTDTLQEPECLAASSDLDEPFEVLVADVCDGQGTSLQSSLGTS